MTASRGWIRFGLACAALIAALGAGGGRAIAEDDPPGPQPPAVDRQPAVPATGDGAVQPTPVKRMPPHDCRIKCLPDAR
jgi:hypothetical protein